MLAVGDALLLTCEARAENRGDWGKIDFLVLRMEADGTLQEALKIGKASLPPGGGMRTCNNPVLIADEGFVHLIYHLHYEQAFIVTSGDEGRTWGKHREIASCYRAFPYAWTVCATGLGHGIRMDSGRLIASGWLANGAQNSDGTCRHASSVAGCIYSDDRGATWHPGVLAAPLDNGNETTVA